ncbi:hypothetical protein [Clostridium aciditolerans]|uniref:Uncharacterized protein n=1 Tax=Clostridium aciditolerans TaxID=339861 RepID=A0A934I0P3_9CLOT|nr:hypothetical protein [Clostridium aciditolerans]MBI6875599.1 hypothetical protein [Clostridium aciditolerans]
MNKKFIYIENGKLIISDIEDKDKNLADFKDVELYMSENMEEKDGIYDSRRELGDAYVVKQGTYVLEEHKNYYTYCLI